MILQRLLGETPVEAFLGDVLFKQPFARAAGADDVLPFADFERVEAIIARDDADVLVCRQGQRWEENRKPRPGEALELYRSGYTLLVRHAERHDDQLAGIAADFQRDLQAPVNVHVYCTPAEEFGFGWHYDAEDVFILQAAGSKEYSLRKNTVNPWPLEETLPLDMKYEREQMPMMKCELRPADWLYIPHGYWHMGTSKTDAISVAVGAMTPSAVDAFDFLRRRLLESLLWRQRLPIAGEAAGGTTDAVVAEYAERFRELAADLSKTFQDEAFLRSYLEQRKGGGEG